MRLGISGRLMNARLARRGSDVGEDRNKGFDGFYYAHILILGLTTQGKGVVAALLAARELAEVWVAEKCAHDEVPPTEKNTFVGHIELPDAVVGA